MAEQTGFELPEWAYAYGDIQGSGQIKLKPADFSVEEQLPFAPEGSGEHVFVQIKKTAENTEYVARLLARFAGVRQRDVSYAGLKDRHAVTTQWFSVWLPGKSDPEWSQFETENIQVLQAKRHARKLKRGVLSGNHFEIIIRDWRGDKARLDEQLNQIKTEGIPNYFGSQRFGLQGQNVNKAIALFQGAKMKRETRSIYLSAVRSFLFNQILSNRIKAGNWNQGIDGDVLMFDDSKSYFQADHLDHETQARIKTGDVHPTGLMAGKGPLETTTKARAFEDEVLQSYPALWDGLIKFDMNSDRRALRVFARDLEWEFQSVSELRLRFYLSSGSYATALLRELINQ